jgi:2-amino-4-hydroxy-6-hydroxymethyldihydropteridine diphosphokinase
MPEQRLLDCIIGIGSNIEPEKNIPKALALLGEQLKIVAVSSVWETKAVGTEGPDFLNAAVWVETSLSANALKREILGRIETEMGRMRSTDKYAPRPIDLDIIIYGGKILDRELLTQAHVAVPAAEIIPGFIQPPMEETLAEIARNMLDETDLRERSSVIIG